MARIAAAALALAGLLGGATAEQGLFAGGADVTSQHDQLHEQMSRMMDDDDDDDDVEKRVARETSAGLIQTAGAEDAYLEESEGSLSAALGPRWDAQKLEVDANKNTKALLRGISGGRAMKSIKGMLSAMQAMD